MIVSYDPEAGATYVSYKDDVRVARTETISDLVMVDLDRDHDVVGVEFVVPLHSITQQMLRQLADYRPEPFKRLFSDQTWMLQPSA